MLWSENRDADPKVRGRRLLAWGLAAGLAGTLPAARADVVDTYQRSASSHERQRACAVEGPDHDQIEVCGRLSDYDGDGQADSSHIEVARRRCTTEGRFTRCEEEFGSAGGGQVVIDRAAGTASILGDVEGCGVDVSFVATGHQASGGPRTEWNPGLRLRDLEVRTASGWSYESERFDADAAGALCDWHDGSFDTATIEWVRYDEDVEQGLSLHPEDAPVAGDAFHRGKRPTSTDVDETACADWWSDGDWLQACAHGSDADGDGQAEGDLLVIERGSCDGFSCTSITTSSDEITEFWVDLEAASGVFRGRVGDCLVDVELAPPPGGWVAPQPAGRGSSPDGRDTVAPGERPGEVVLGESTAQTDESRSALPTAESVACDWPAAGGAEVGSWGDLRRRTTEHHEHYYGVDPGRLVPSG